ncbi:hypothetical protein PY73_06370, partial [Lacticaseibacillus rhamnosus]
VIDVKISDLRPIPVEQLVLDKQTQDPEAVDAFVKKYHAETLILSDSYSRMLKRQLQMFN